MVQNQTPTQKKERIVSLDILRGFAVLGILIMNVQAFSMIFAAYQNPFAFGDLTGANLLVWKLSHVFADLKFMTIFSILFGAGIYLMSNKLESKGLNPKNLHIRRMLWLLLFGLLHGYFLWHGDILVNYACVAFFVFLLRNKSVKLLLSLGLVSILIPFLLNIMSGWSMSFWPEEQINTMAEQWLPTQETINTEMTAFTGSWWSGVTHRWSLVLMMQTVFLLFYGWRIFGLMLLGIVLFKSGFLSAKKSYKMYLLSMLACFGIGFTLIIAGMNNCFNDGWSLEYSRFFGLQYNYIGSIFVSLGYISVIMLIVKSGVFSRWSIFGSVGQMAFTNYLLQTIICTTIFYGYGFAKFGTYTRLNQIILVFLIWIFQLVFSVIWLKYFKYGPFEWLWRSLSYKKMLSIKK